MAGPDVFYPEESLLNDLRSDPTQVGLGRVRFYNGRTRPGSTSDIVAVASFSVRYQVSYLVTLTPLITTVVTDTFLTIDDAFVTLHGWDLFFRQGINFATKPERRTVGLISAANFGQVQVTDEDFITKAESIDWDTLPTCLTTPIGLVVTVQDWVPLVSIITTPGTERVVINEDTNFLITAITSGGSAMPKGVWWAQDPPPIEDVPRDIFTVLSWSEDLPFPDATSGGLDFFAHSLVIGYNLTLIPTTG